MLLLVIILLLLLGGGFGWSRYDYRGGPYVGAAGLIAIILLVYLLLAGGSHL